MSLSYVYKRKESSIVEIGTPRFYVNLPAWVAWLVSRVPLLPFHDALCAILLYRSEGWWRELELGLPWDKKQWEGL
jgi:hypothetical protein